MAALAKVTGRRVEEVAQVIPDPPPQPQPSLPPNPVQTPPPALPSPRDPWNYYGGFFDGPNFIPATSFSTRTIYVGGIAYSATFAGGQQFGPWISTALIKLYPDNHPLARTRIPEWDYFNW